MPVRLVTFVLADLELFSRHLVEVADGMRRERAVRIVPALNRRHVNARLVQRRFELRHDLAADILGDDQRAVFALGRFGGDSFPGLQVFEVGAQHGAQAVIGLAGELRGQHLDVVRRDHGRQHAALAVANLAARRRQRNGTDDVLRRHPVEVVALDNLQIEKPNR